MKRAMGHSMLRKDDPEHHVDRDSYGTTLRPGTIKNHWDAIFEGNTAKYLDELKAKGPGADFVWDYAAPYAAENLRLICGFHNATQEDMQRWSQTMIDGTGNYADDPDVWAKAKHPPTRSTPPSTRCCRTCARTPDPSLLSGLASMPIPLEAIRANLKMTIGGGLNEPRDVLATTAWALLTNPEQLDAVRADPKLLAAAFEESVRWVAPIGMYPRQTTRETVLGGVRLPAGARLGVVLGAANRDPRGVRGPGDPSTSARQEAAPGLRRRTALLRRRLGRPRLGRPGRAARGSSQSCRNLRLDPANAAVDAGWVFRGMTSMPVAWD